MEEDHGEEEESQEEEMEQEQAPAQASQQQPKGKRQAAKKNTEADPGQFQCLCCRENCRKNQQAVKCVMCSLWAHKIWIKMPDVAFKALEAQQKETGTEFYVCRPCQNFAAKVQYQNGEQNKRNEETERKVSEHAEKIKKNSTEIEELRKK